MSTRNAWTLCAALAVVALNALRAQGPVRASTVVLPANHVVIGVNVADVNGDGMQDLVVAASRPTKERPRTLLVFLSTKAGEAPVLAPERSFDLPPDVVGMATGDIHGELGEETILFSTTGVFALRQSGDPKERIVKLASVNLLWQSPAWSDVLDLSAFVVDLDSDGLKDFLIPEPDGYRLLGQSTSADGQRSFAIRAILNLPKDLGASEDEEGRGPIRVSAAGGRRRVELRLPFDTSGQIQDRRPFLEIADRAPSPHLHDVDADRDLDVIAQTETHLLVWTQQERAFREEPSFRWQLPVPAGRDRRFDVSYSSHARDFDRDGKVDTIVIASDQDAKDVRTQILVFTQNTKDRRRPKSAAAPLFGPEGIPNDLLVVGGFVLYPDFSDVDGDGFDDLSLVLVRPEDRDPLGSKPRDFVEATLQLWRNDGGTLARLPMATFPLFIPTVSVRRGTRPFAAQFIADWNGDGIQELLLRTQSETLRLIPGRRRSDGQLTFDGDALFETSLEQGDGLQLQRFKAGQVESILVIEDARIRIFRAQP